MLGVDFPAQHDHPVLTPYCEQHAAMFFPELLMYYSLLVYLWFKCWGWLFLGLSKKLSKVQEGGQEISRLWDTFPPSLSNNNQVPLQKGCKVSLITTSLLRCPQHFFFEASATGVMRTSTNNQLMNCSVVAHVPKTKDPGTSAFLYD